MSAMMTRREVVAVELRMHTTGATSVLTLAVLLV
jgi:hypothetical protein